MTPIHELLNGIRWDKEFGRAWFELGYFDRREGVIQRVAWEHVENSSLHYEPSSRTWWLFTNHVGLRDGLEYTDAIWVYWTTNLDRWDAAHKAVVLDSKNCKWSRHIIGLPSVVPVGRRLAVFYDGNAAMQMPTGVKSHMNRDLGMAWLDLPLVPLTTK